MRFAIIAVVCIGLFAQDISLMRTPRLTDHDGVVVQTGDGLKTAHPVPGYSYARGDKQVYLLQCSPEASHVIGDPGARDAVTGYYILRARPNPVMLAVYRDGMRLMANQFRVVWIDKNELPDRVEVFGATAQSSVLFDYIVGVSSRP